MSFSNSFVPWKNATFLQLRCATDVFLLYPWTRAQILESVLIGLSFALQVLSYCSWHAADGLRTYESSPELLRKSSCQLCCSRWCRCPQVCYKIRNPGKIDRLLRDHRCPALKNSTGNALLVKGPEIFFNRATSTADDDHVHPLLYPTSGFPLRYSAHPLLLVSAG